MTETKNLIFTFDYELFLGSRSGTAKNCILKPTEKLVELFNKYSITGSVFFVDTVYLLRLKDNPAAACREDFKKIREQLYQLHKSGHYLYPHIHPHWIDAQYLPDINQWDLTNISKYSFSSLNSKEKDFIFAESLKLLEEICGSSVELGYRAGGWCIQPFSAFLPYFKKYGIKYDFTVMRGYYCIDDTQSFDFRNAPSKEFYNFEEDVIKENTTGHFTELPISILKISYLNRLLNKLFARFLLRKGILNFGDGYSAHSASLKEIKPAGNKMASLELLSIININDYLSAIEKRNSVQFISHPKMLSPHNLTCFEVLLKKTISKYKVNTDFKKMLDPLHVNVSAPINEPVDIILISYVFPPYPGIGGRRWTKFAKYLSRKNYRVHVICAGNPFKETSIWTKDILENKNIIIHKLPPKYPSILLKKPNNFTERLLYKIWDIALPFFTKGNHYDRAIFWENILLKKCLQIIEKTKTKNIIVSGAPFNCNYYVTELKKKIEGINLISDIRDPWTWVDTYGLALISAKKRKTEEFKEQEVLKLSDTILVPAEAMKKHLIDKYPEYATKVKVLPHGYDPEEIVTAKRTKEGDLRLLFYGNIYEGIGPYFEEIANAIKASGNSIFIDLYSDSEKYKEIFSNAGVLDNVRYYKSVKEKELFEKMHSYSGVLIAYPDYAINFISTKFYEIIYAKMPIIFIGNRGKTSEFIRENRLGYFIEPNEIIDKLVKIQNRELIIDYNYEFNVSKFSFDNLTQELINYLT